MLLSRFGEKPSLIERGLSPTSYPAMAHNLPPCLPVSGLIASREKLLPQMIVSGSQW